MGHSNFLTISDLQIPFEHTDALDFIIHLYDVLTAHHNHPPTVICMGDEVDQHTLGKYPSAMSAKSPTDEFIESVKRLQMWYEHFPKVFVCNSNHTYRVFKRAQQAEIPAQFMRSIKEAYQAPPDWKWADRWVFDGICFEHGENVSGKNAALQAAEQNRMATTIGHQHTFGGVIYSNSISGQIWGLNTGCLIDVDQYAFEYGKNLRKKPTLGTGVIIGGVPYFVPMILGKNKRWIRRAYLPGLES